MRMFVSKENLILMHFISGPAAAPKIEAFVHQFFQALERGRSRLCAAARFRRAESRYRFAIACNKNIFTCFGFPKKAGKLLVRFPCSDGAHALGFR
jgi:hypothetical protein